MAIRGLWNIQPIVGIYTYPILIGNQGFVGIWKICGDVPIIKEYPSNFKYPHL
jgi:hypothetical protein